MDAGDKGGPGHGPQLVIRETEGGVTDPVQQLEGGQDGVDLESTPEHPEFHRAAVLEIDAGIASAVVALLGIVQDLHGLLLVAVPGGPALQLPGGTAAELEELFPVLLEEVEDPGNGGVLLLLRNAEGHAVHMDVEAAAAGPMAEVAQVNGFPAEFFPGHFMELAVQGHGVGHQLQTVVQRAVVLDVEEFLLGVGDPEKGTGVVPVLAAAVDL